MFTKILALARLRAWVIAVTAYLDDLLIIDQSTARLGHNVHSTVEYLEYLGWVLNLKKSSLQPQKRLEYLGMIIH